MALDSGIFVKIDHFLKSLIFNQKSVIFCYYQTCFIFKKWMRFYSKITLFFKKEWENTLKWKNSKVPPLQWHFWTIFERVLTRAKIVFHTFWPPKRKILKILSKIGHFSKIENESWQGAISQKLTKILREILYYQTPFSIFIKLNNF